MVRRTLTIIAVLALTACADAGQGPARDATPTTADAGPTAQSPSTLSQMEGARTATLKATADGPASISYSVGGSDVRQDITGPWEKAVPVGDSTALSLTVVAEDGQVTRSVGCEIAIPPNVTVKNLSSGAPATTSCHAYVS